MASKILILALILVLVLIILTFPIYCKKDFFENPSLSIYIISLEKHKEGRLKLLQSKIKPDPRYNIKRIYAVDGQKEIEGFLSKGQIGCWLSHVEMWREIVKNKESYALILEDDADILLPYMMTAIENVHKSLPDKWDMCFLSGWWPDTSHIIKVSDIFEKSDISPIYGTHAYLLSYTGASNLLAQSSDFNNSKSQKTYDNIDPVDHWMTHPDRNLIVYKTIKDLVPNINDGISDTSL